MRCKQLVVVCFIIISFGLSGSAQISAPQIIPPSPKTQEFNKYIDYNVSMYNGLPDINIPLYTIKLKGLDIPLNMSYHASGIKFRQDNGEVGVGWNLSEGYRVSRSICGLPDEKRAKPSGLIDSLEYYTGDYPGRDKYLSKFIRNEYNNRPYSFDNDLVDGEYDIFNFNLPGQGGAFIITDRSAKTVKTIESSNVRFNYATGIGSSPANINGITGFQITDESGVKYYTGESLPQTNSWVYESTSSLNAQQVATAWALTDIVTPFADKAHFKYDKGDAGGWNFFSKSFTVGELQLIETGDLSSTYSAPSEGVDQTYTTFFLNEITTLNEKVLFTRQEGTHLITAMSIQSLTGDLIKKIRFFYTPIQAQILLDSINISDAADHVVETYRFDYYPGEVIGQPYVSDQWGYYLGAANYNNVFHSQFKDDIVLYQFESGTPSLRNISELCSDFTRRDNIEVVPQFYSLKRITYPTGGSTEFYYESNRYLDGGVLRDGGGLRIESIISNDSARYGDALYQKYVYGTNESGYGFTNNQMYFDYKCFVTENVSFRLIPVLYNKMVPQRQLTYFSHVQGDIDPAGFIGSYITYPFVTEYTKKGGKTTYQYDLGLQYNVNAYPAPMFNGVLPLHMQYHNSSPLYISRYRFWDKPLLKEKRVYAGKNNIYNIIGKESYTYTQSQYTNYEGLKVRPFAIAGDYNPIWNGDYYEYISSFFNAGRYTIECAKNVLTEKRAVNYALTDSIVTQVTYNYNNIGLVSTEITTNSKGDELKNSYKYPTDILSTVTATPSAQTNPIGFMVANNMITAPLESIKTIKKDGVEKIVSGNLTTFKGSLINHSGNNIYTVVPDKQFQFESISPVPVGNYSNFSITNTLGAEVNVIDSKMKLKLSSDKYDGYGNIQQYTFNKNAPKNYIWDYNGKYPVAEITGSSVDKIAYTSFESDGWGGWTMNGGSTILNAGGLTGNKSISGGVTKTVPLGDYIVSVWSTANTYINSLLQSQTPLKTIGSWRYFEVTLTNVTSVEIHGDNIDEVRLYPVGAQMSTYTYDPFIGITSQCDEANKVLYFEYDGYGRLKTIRDQDRKILKTMDYQFHKSYNQ